MKKLLKITSILLLLLYANAIAAHDLGTLDIRINPLIKQTTAKCLFMATSGERLYFGAEDASSNDGAAYAQSIYMFDLQTKQIEKQYELDAPVRNCGFVAYNGGILLVGGETLRGASQQVYFYQANSDSLQTLPSLPRSLSSPMVSVVNNQLMVAAGEHKGKPNTEAWTLNLKEHEAKWNSIASMPFNDGKITQSAVQNGGDEDLWYLFGNTVLTYSIKWNKWLQPNDSVAIPFDVALHQPISIGTHHILFLDDVGGYGSYHTITGKWNVHELTQNKGLSSLVSQYGSAAIMMTSTGNINELSFDSNVTFGSLNYGVLIIYMCLMLGIGFYFSRRAGTSDQFFKGGGQIPWWAAGISIFATTLSAITFMALPAKAYTTNWLYFPMSFSILLVAPIVIRWYLPFFRGLKLTSAYEYLEQRFNLTVRLTSSILFILFMIMRIGIVLYLPSVALSTVTGIDLMACILMMSVVTIIYSTLGGVEAVVWGDVIQGGILVFGAIISVVYLVVGTGGFTETISIGMAAEKFKMLDFSFDFKQPTFWVIFFGAGLANSLITYTSDQTIVQRYLTTSDMNKSRRSIWLNGIIALPVLVLFYFIGTALYTFFFAHPALLPLTMNNAEGIFPYFIVNELPAGIAGLLIAAIFAATMSTLSSNINSASTAITVDFAKRIFPSISDKQQVNTARISGVIVGIVGTFLAIELSMMSVKSFFDEFNTFIGLLTSGLGGLFAIGIFLPRVRGYAALAALVCSVVILWWLRSHSSINFMLYGLVGILLSLVLAFIFSYLIPEKKKDLTKLTWSQRK
ncbi:MAG: sodium:solute symporter family transporter [Bacteroidales bacterium]